MMIDWSNVPELVSIEMAARLYGVDVGIIDHVIDFGGVDAVERDGETLVTKESMIEFWDIYCDATDFWPGYGNIRSEVLGVEGAEGIYRPIAERDGGGEGEQ